MSGISAADGALPPTGGNDGEDTRWIPNKKCASSGISVGKTYG